MLHDSFFLSEYKVLNIFICGIGTVGGMLLEQIRTQQQFLMQSRRLKLNVVGISDVANFVLDRDGIDLDNYEQILRAGFPANTEHMRDEIVKMNIFNSVFVDCTASKQIATLYQTFLALQKEARERYVQRCGPLRRSDMLGMGGYGWTEGPWPWEYRPGKEA